MNSVERAILKVALKAEQGLAKVWGTKRQARVVEPYIGFATASEIVLHGRVHSDMRLVSARYGQSRLRNVAQMLRRFLTSEVAGARVSVGEAITTSDEEGYFELRVPRDGRSGWLSFDVRLDDGATTVTCEAYAARPSDIGLIISDIDDTVLKTGAYSLVRNLWTSFTGNELTRQVFADAAVLLDRLNEDGRRPVYYVSSSPWNLFQFLQTIFMRSGVVKGPMMLRDLGLAADKLITSGHGDHKSNAIDRILAANPDQPAILIGDTGQEDAKIYGDAILRHPGRVIAVVLREPGRGADSNDKKAIARVREAGVPVFHAPTFAGMEPEIRKEISGGRRMKLA